MPHTPYTALLLSATAVSTLLGLLAWREGPTRFFRSFALLSFAVALWALGYALEIIVPGVAAKHRWLLLQWVGICVAPLAWLALSATYAGRRHWLSGGRLPALCVVPALSLLLVATNDRHGLVYAGSELDSGVLRGTYGPWFWLHTAYSYALILAGAGLVLSRCRRAPHGERAQVVAMALAALAPLLCNVLLLTGLDPIAPLDPTPMAFAFSDLSFGYALFRLRLLRPQPVAREALFDAMGDGVIVLDRERRIVDLNAAARDLLGGIATARQGTSIEKLLPWCTGVLDRLGDGGCHVLHSEDGRTSPDPPRHIDLRVSPLRDRTDRLVGQLLILRDVTEQTVMQREVEEAQRMQAVGQLAGGVAHDFNNLLTIISGYADAARSAISEDHRVRRDLEQIIVASERGSSLTRQLLTFGRRQHSAPESIDLGDVVREMEDLFRRVLGEQIELRLELGQRRVTVHADRRQLEQVLVNLVVNAQQAMPDGGRLSISIGETERSGYPARGRRRRFGWVRVEDTGIGMDAETRRRVFEPFFTTKRSNGGIGMGLCSAYSIVQGHGGFIQVSSAPGAGTVFDVCLPTAEAEAADVEKPAGGDDRGTETVLLVEDEPAVLQLVTSILTDRGYRVLPASGPRAALELASHSNQSIDALVTDIVMPEMNGARLANDIRARHPGIGVLFVSGYGDDHLQPQGVSERDGHMLPKPFAPGELTRKLRQILDERQLA